MKKIFITALLFCAVCLLTDQQHSDACNIDYIPVGPATSLSMTEPITPDKLVDIYDPLSSTSQNDPEEPIYVPEEYLSAYKIWIALKDAGYSDQATAGILGNVMAEVGGQTLEIRHWLYGSAGGCYGICQWSNVYFPEVQGTDLDYQIQFLLDTVEGQFDYCDELYDYTLEEFKNEWDETNAALKFAQIYERCDPVSYYTRKKNATTAYRYFTDLEKEN